LVSPSAWMARFCNADAPPPVLYKRIGNYSLV
jgi:hypothetical protein